jgi:predicted Fe-S protein YdhL (DUF1289 family)
MKNSFPQYNSDETSVCIKVCRLNISHTHCIGCKRSLLEIEQWRDYSAEKKKELIKELNVRIITD